MKILKFIMVISSVFLIAHTFAEEEVIEEKKPVSIDETIIKEEQVTQLDFDELRENASEQTKELVPGTSESETNLECINCLYPHNVVGPITQGLAYVKGVLCHVGNYPYSTIITVLEGRNYGLQTTVDYNGYVLSVNYAYVIEHSPAGVTFHHAYPNCTVVTGLDQVIIFN